MQTELLVGPAFHGVGMIAECPDHSFHHAGQCASMLACLSGAAVPVASPEIIEAGAESAQDFRLALLPHDRATLPRTPPPR